MYDILAGKENMESSYLMTKGRALETFPMLKSEGLVGALVYYDGMHILKYRATKGSLFVVLLDRSTQ